MSIFDTEALLKSSKKKIEFFHRSQLPVHFKKVLLECEIFFQKQNGSLISYFLKLADHKFVLYKVCYFYKAP